MMIKENKSGDGEGKEGGTELPQGRKEGRISMKEQKLIKAERRERWKLKKAKREKNKKEREKKQQEKMKKLLGRGKKKPESSTHSECGQSEGDLWGGNIRGRESEVSRRE